MKKVIMTLVITFCVVILCNVKVGFTQEGQGVQQRLDYLESRISEITTVQEDNTSTIDSLKGLKDKVSLGFGMRTSFLTTEDAAGTKGDGRSGGRSWDKDFNVDNMRLYMGAKITDNISATFNTEISNTTVADDVRLLDAFVELKMLKDYFKIRFGRHLPAADRYSLNGPYYQNSFQFPGLVVKYPNTLNGRVEGVSFWGLLADKKFKWQFSVAEGTEVSGGPNDDPDHFQYSGHLVYNFWEPEPGFYNSGTYYGKKDVLALGLAMFHQSDAVGTAAEPSDYTGWNVDFLLEKNFGWGTIDIEAAYYDYNNHKAAATGALSDGQAWEAGFGYLYPEKIGWGQPQFVSRWQQFDPTDNMTSAQFSQSKLELGLHYIIEGHNGMIALVYSNEHLGSGTGSDVDWNEDQSAVRLGMQFQH